MKEKIGELLNKFKDLLLGLWSEIFHPAKTSSGKSGRVKGQGTKWQWAAVPGKFRAALTGIVDFFTNRFPERKSRLMLFGLGGLAVLFLILVITVLAVNFGKPKESSGPDLAAGPAIPPEELFMPAEPDFLPKYLLQREPRSSWSLGDIRPYWKSPGDPEFWRGEIKSTVDKLMEGVP